MSFPRMLIVEDHPLVADALRGHLQSLLPQLVCVHVETLQQGLDCLQYSPAFSLVLIDLNLPDSRGLSTLHAFCNSRPAGSLAVFTSMDHPDLQATCLANDVLYLSKSKPVTQVLTELMAILVKDWQHRHEHVHLVMEEHDLKLGSVKELSKRQFLVLAQLAQGKTSREIAQTLRIAETTVRSHVSKIYQRLEVKNRIQASMRYVLWMQQQGMDAC